MKTAYFDCRFGAAGDMLLASLLHAGLDEKKWLEEVRKIALPEGSYQIKISNVERCSVTAKKVDVLDKEGEQLDYLYHIENETADHSHAHEHSHVHEHTHTHEHSHGDHAHSHPHTHSHSHSHEHRHNHEHGDDHHHSHDHDHAHEHGHTHEHEHEHEHAHEHGHTHAHEHGHEHSHEGTRHLSEVLEIIQNSKITARAKDLASRIFKRLAVSEGRVHGVAPEDVHFHEVGAVDAIVDIVGFAIAYDMLQIQRSVVSPLPLGSGRVHTAHGYFPAPGPAVIYLLTEVQAPTLESNANFECLTPTGAAILAEIADSWGTPPAFSHLLHAGYGAGSKNPTGWPNVARVLIGDTEPSAKRDSTPVLSHELVAVVEANIDDFSPQALSYASEKLLQAGALDVFVTPVVMKKGRSGHLLTVLTEPRDRERIQSLIVQETSSIGVRFHLSERACAAREWQEVELGHHERVRLKIARDLAGKVLNVQPEYEDCARYASAHQIPLKEVLAEAISKYQES